MDVFSDRQHFRRSLKKLVCVLCGALGEHIPLFKDLEEFACECMCVCVGVCVPMCLWFQVTVKRPSEVLHLDERHTSQ